MTWILLLNVAVLCANVGLNLYAMHLNQQTRRLLKSPAPTLEPAILAGQRHLLRGVGEVLVLDVTTYSAIDTKVMYRTPDPDGRVAVATLEDFRPNAALVETGDYAAFQMYKQAVAEAERGPVR